MVVVTVVVVVIVVVVVVEVMVVVVVDDLLRSGVTMVVRSCVAISSYRRGSHNPSVVKLTP